MKFKLVNPKPKNNKELSFKGIDEIEKFITDALIEKFEKEQQIDKNDLLIVPQKVVITCESDDFLTIDVKIRLNIFGMTS